MASIAHTSRSAPLVLARLALLVVAARLWAQAVSVPVESLASVAPIPTPIPILGAFFVQVLGLALAGAVYVAVRGLDLRLWPRDRSWSAAVLAVVGPAAAVVATAAVANALGTPFSDVAQQWYAPSVSPGFVAATGLPEAVFGGLGYGVLLCGAVQTDIIETAPSLPTAVFVAALAAFFITAPFPSGSRTATAVGVGLWVLIAALAVGFGYGLGLADHIAAGDLTPSTGQLAVGLLGAVAAVGVGSELVDLPAGAYDATFVLAAAVAAAGYERSRSVLVPVLAFVAFEAAVTAVVYAEAVLGVATPP